MFTPRKFGLMLLGLTCDPPDDWWQDFILHLRCQLVSLSLDQICMQRGEKRVKAHTPRWNTKREEWICNARRGGDGTGWGAAQSCQDDFKTASRAQKAKWEKKNKFTQRRTPQLTRIWHESANPEEDTRKNWGKRHLCKFARNVEKCPEIWIAESPLILKLHGMLFSENLSTYFVWLCVVKFSPWNGYMEEFTLLFRLQIPFETITIQPSELVTCEA